MDNTAIMTKFINNETWVGLLAFSPLLLITTSSTVGFAIGLLSLVLLFVLTLIIYPLRTLLSLPQRLVFILMVSVTLVLVVRLLLEAGAYSFTEKIGLFLPLIIMNSLVISENEALFSVQKTSAAIIRMMILGLIILLFFVAFGFMREVLMHYSILTELNQFSMYSFAGINLIDSDPGFSIFTSSAGCFFILGFLYALLNFVNGYRVSPASVE